MKEYNWNSTDRQAGDIRLPAELMPNRVALTATAIVTSNDSSRVLLVDPHPEGTWDTWMFPYASLILDKKQIEDDSKSVSKRKFLDLEPGVTLGTLGAALDELMEVYRDEYRQALDTNLNNIMPDVVGDWSGDPFYEHYTLKYSRTSESYTAYRFSYYARTSSTEPSTVDYVWVQPDTLLSIDIEKDAINGKKVAEGDPDALRHLMNI
ncbi:hypothetical protein ACFQ05_06670 [Amycolatopsis umgeniensis]|uniref:Uncharacterized protein n=1 Tax=Amycolatopsis umgeniensis TaxID=336628 RepID=A0A841B2M2_9PSEU|nr:hypothetical protein [Amycolatopsis umgeniensis]MBB5852965.1 hypothetical protein [Amycolatopsis umgeniensis]